RSATKKAAEKSTLVAKLGGPLKKASASLSIKKNEKVKEKVIKYKFTSEEVEFRFAELISNDQITELTFENLLIMLEKTDLFEVEAELFIRFLSIKPG
ncbi:2194_t:CDS:2, partial [Funneliformis mosseae]